MATATSNLRQRIPDDVSVAGFDDVIFAMRLTPLSQRSGSLCRSWGRLLPRLRSVCMSVVSIQVICLLF